MLKNPIPIGTAQLTSKHSPHELSFEKAKTRINLDKIYKDKQL